MISLVSYVTLVDDEFARQSAGQFESFFSRPVHGALANDEENLSPLILRSRAAPCSFPGVQDGLIGWLEGCALSSAGSTLVFECASLCLEGSGLEPASPCSPAPGFYVPGSFCASTRLEPPLGYGSNRCAILAEPEPGLCPASMGAWCRHSGLYPNGNPLCRAWLLGDALLQNRQHSWMRNGRGRGVCLVFDRVPCPVLGTFKMLFNALYYFNDYPRAVGKRAFVAGCWH